jgi:hypothetical protein
MTAEASVSESIEVFTEQFTFISWATMQYLTSGSSYGQGFVTVHPRGCEYVGGTEPVSIRLVDGSTIDSSDTFTVLMIAIDSTLFSSEEVTL